MCKTVDSYHFIWGLTKRMVKSWINLEPPREIPWTPLQKPVSESRVAMISTAAIALKSDIPFDQEGEKNNPWWGDPSYRIIPHGVKTEEINVYHQHIDTAFAEQDINCILPVDRLEELKNKGRIGSIAGSHYSFMGYTLQPDELLKKSVPQIIKRLREEQVDIVILVPV